MHLHFQLMYIQAVDTRGRLFLFICASTAYVVAIWPSFLFDSFVKIWDTCENFLGKWFTAPPPTPPRKKFPVRLWSIRC